MIGVRRKYYRYQSGQDSSENMTTINFGRIPSHMSILPIHSDSSEVDGDDRIEMTSARMEREMGMDNDLVLFQNTEIHNASR